MYTYTYTNTCLLLTRKEFTCWDWGIHTWILRCNRTKIKLQLIKVFLFFSFSPKSLVLSCLQLTEACRLLFCKDIQCAKKIKIHTTYFPNVWYHKQNLQHFALNSSFDPTWRSPWAVWPGCRGISWHSSPLKRPLHKPSALHSPTRERSGETKQEQSSQIHP